MLPSKIQELDFHSTVVFMYSPPALFFSCLSLFCHLSLSLCLYFSSLLFSKVSGLTAGHFSSEHLVMTLFLSLYQHSVLDSFHCVASIM